MSCRYDCQNFCTFIYSHYWFLHTLSHCADLPMKFHWGSPRFLISLLSPSSDHLIRSYVLHWGKRRFVTHYLTAKWWMTLWQGLSFNCAHDPKVTFSTWGRMGYKIGTREVCCSKHEVEEQLMMLPEDVLEVWRDVNRSHSYSLFPPSLSFSLFLHLAAFRACSKRFWDPGHLPILHLSSPFPLCPGELFKLDGDSQR